jgi:hypothetical protein
MLCSESSPLPLERGAESRRQLGGIHDKVTPMGGRDLVLAGDESAFEATRRSENQPSILLGQGNFQKASRIDRT